MSSTPAKSFTSLQAFHWTTSATFPGSETYLNSLTLSQLDLGFGSCTYPMDMFVLRLEEFSMQLEQHAFHARHYEVEDNAVDRFCQSISVVRCLTYD